MKSLLKDQKGQLSFQGISSGIMLAIMYIVEAGYVFSPAYNALSPVAANFAGGFGVISMTLLLLGVFIFMPLLVVQSMISLAQERVRFAG